MTQAIRQSNRIGRGCTGQDEEELIAANTSDRPVFTYGLLKHPAIPTEQRVTTAMPVAVIERKNAVGVGVAQHNGSTGD